MAENDFERELRDIALQKLGLTSDRHDYNLGRITQLTARALNYDTVIFSMLEGERAIEIARNPSASTKLRTTELCADVARTAKAVALPDLQREPDHRLAQSEPCELHSYLAMPIYSPDKRPIGTLSLFASQAVARDTALEIEMANDYVRLIEDSLLLRTMSVRDPLTGMFNRRYFEEQIGVEWRRAARMQTPISFVLIDVDRFKLYNDTGGHAAGDEALVQVADVIREGCQRAGDVACRFGGEEFAMLLPSTPAAAAVDIVNGIRARLKTRRIPHPGTGGVLSFSGGVATAQTEVDMDRGSFADYIAQADRALYIAKERGRDQICHIDIPPPDQVELTPPDRLVTFAEVAARR